MHRKMLFILLLAFTTTAHAINFSDLWWNPAESGWGINIAQQGDTIFATWFIYGVDGKPTWIVMSNGSRKAPNKYQGDIFETTGSSYSASTFDPSRVVTSKVGNATIEFLTAHEATLTYTVSGLTVVKSIRRQSFGPMALEGGYSLRLIEPFRDKCYAISNNTGSATGMMTVDPGPSYFSDPYGRYLMITKLTGGSYGVSESTYAGPLPVGERCSATVTENARNGRYVTLAGTYVCSNDRRGNIVLTDVEVTVDDRNYANGNGRRLFGEFQTTDTEGEKCRSSGKFSAAY